MRSLPIRGDPDLYHTLSWGFSLLTVVSRAAQLSCVVLAYLFQATMTGNMRRCQEQTMVEKD
jgi:hypothetical protein